MSNIYSFEFPALETERVNLRILTLNESEALFKHFSDEHVTRFMDIEPCKDINEAEEMIKSHMEDPGCRWGLFEKNKEIMIGTVGFHYLRRNNGSFVAEVGYDLSKEFWGKGYMNEVMNAVILFGFNQMGLNSIDATVEIENERSITLLEKLGFKRDPELRDNLLYYYLDRNDH